MTLNLRTKRKTPLLAIINGASEYIEKCTWQRSKNLELEKSEDHSHEENEDREEPVVELHTWHGFFLWRPAWLSSSLCKSCYGSNIAVHCDKNLR